MPESIMRATLRPPGGLCRRHHNRAQGARGLQLETPLITVTVSGKVQFVARCMKTVAYLRISTGSQDLANQKLAILDHARQNRFAIDRFVEAQASSRKGRDQRRIEELLGTLAVGDRLVVSELSRLGRSLGQVIQLVDELVTREVRFIAIKEAIRFEG